MGQELNQQLTMWSALTECTLNQEFLGIRAVLAAIQALQETACRIFKG
jgi:hypothetical protein